MDTNVDKPIELDELVKRCGGERADLPLDGASGLLMQVEAEWGILVHEGDSRRRRRFTVAHELGHFCIPKHSKTAVICISPETTRGDSDKATEREANEFAAELLMPRKAVQPMISTGAIDLARATEVSDTYDVSLLSAAIRVCELTRERAAIAYFRRGKLAWAFRHGLPYGLPAHGSEPPVDSVVHDIVCGRNGSENAAEVDPAVWLPLGCPDSTWGELLESSVSCDGDDGIVTLLWMTAGD